MTLVELVNLLKQTGYPVAYSHFNSSPTIPYITYRDTGADNFKADNITYFYRPDIEVELYTNKKDLTAETNLQNLLDSNDISWDVDEIWIDAEELFQRIYYLGVKIDG